MPVQIKRLLIAFVIFIGIMLGFKYYLTPQSWGEYGHYRGAALDEIADKEPNFAEMETCAMCHDSIADLKSQGEHQFIECETCHGPGYKHANDSDNIGMERPNGRELCLRCHTKNPARPEDFIKQIEEPGHSEGEECITCHNPHQPWL